MFSIACPPQINCPYINSAFGLAHTEALLPLTLLGLMTGILAGLLLILFRELVEFVTESFNKKTNLDKELRGKDGCEPFLALKLNGNKSIQRVKTAGF